MTNLLVVDWDFYFRNLLESLSGDMKEWLLYDWGHREDMAFMIDAIWGSRAVGFVRNGLPLPDMDQRWRKFADRITLHEDAVIKYADSNLWAGSQAHVGDGYEQVWLFDAHHDLYQYKSLDDWMEKAQEEPGSFRITCEDWMFWHKYQGSELHWRYPDWHDLWKEVEEDDDLEIAKSVDLHYTVDDGQPIDVEFTDVFVCRSGAWVPPWCDDQFEEFLGTFDRDTEQVGPDVDMTRTQWMHVLDQLRMEE